MSIQKHQTRLSKKGLTSYTKNREYRNLAYKSGNEACRYLTKLFTTEKSFDGYPEYTYIFQVINQDVIVGYNIMAAALEAVDMFRHSKRVLAITRVKRKLYPKEGDIFCQPVQTLLYKRGELLFDTMVDKQFEEYKKKNDNYYMIYGGSPTGS